MKKLTLLLTLGVSLLSLPAYAQREIRDVDLSNIKALVVAQWGEVEDIFPISDLDLQALRTYSQITYDIKEYVEKFGDYTQRDYATDMRLLDKRGTIQFIKGFGFDSETGAIVIGDDTYLISNGKTGITYDQEGERDDKGSAEYDTAGRIVKWSWVLQQRPITYSKNGLLNTIQYSSLKYTFTWKDGLLSEVSTCYTYSQNKEEKHFWTKVVEKNSDGYWTELDIYRKTKDTDKVLKWRISRKFSK
jgi:hypothetical protein